MRYSARRILLTCFVGWGCLPLLVAAVVQAAEKDAPAATATTPAYEITKGPFEPTWESLRKYECPEWLKDAKFGIWSHWSAQCVPEQGDWYARGMYYPGNDQYKYHVAHYGHPSEFGFKDIDNLWKAEKWEPEKLMDLYQRAGAKFFVALGNHHDNFDNWDSKYQEWNSVRVGPKKDIVGLWAKAARERGLRFGVSIHASHTWHWFNASHYSDGSGPMKGVPYDGNLTKADGKGKWWEGLDPQELYCKAHPAGNTADAMDLGTPDQPYLDKFFNRTKDVIDQHRPDLVWLDDFDLPFDKLGLSLAAHLYNANTQRHNGRNEAVLNTRIQKAENMSAVVHMMERGRMDQIKPHVWETATCMGNWHYRRGMKYKTPQEIVTLLIDVVSKNGVLMLSVPIRGNGTHDEEEIAVLEGVAKWMKVGGEAIFGTRPWTKFGEGPTKVIAGDFNDDKVTAYTAEDIRFTTKGPTLYAMALAWPADGKLKIRSLAKPAGKNINAVSKVKLLGHEGDLSFEQDEDCLTVSLPADKPCNYAYALAITGDRLEPAGK